MMAQSNSNILAVQLAPDDRWVQGIVGGAAALFAGRAAVKYGRRTRDDYYSGGIGGAVVSSALTLATAFVTYHGLVLVKNAATGVKYIKT